MGRSKKNSTGCHSCRGIPVYENLKLQLIFIEYILNSYFFDLSSSYNRRNSINFVVDCAIVDLALCAEICAIQ